MAEALEEQATQEVVDHDVAIEALKKGVGTVEAESKRLAEEVVGLCAAQSDLEGFKGEVAS
jgi:hypothetical protein